MLQHKLNCPECGATNTFDDGKLFDGMPTGCPRCGTELILSREWDEFDDRYKWLLLVASEEQEDEL